MITVNELREILGRVIDGEVEVRIARVDEQINFPVARVFILGSYVVLTEAEEDEPMLNTVERIAYGV